MNSFVKGTLILIVAAFFGECLEFLINMILARELGEGGLGHYMTILPTIFLIVLLASFELPVSVSKLIAEKDDQYHRSMIGHAVRLTIIFTSVLLLLAAVIFPFLSVFNAYHPMLKWIVYLLIPVISFSSIARGFFMGKQLMGKIAFSHFLRRIVQLLLLAAVYQLFEFDRPTAILIAFCTLAGSELVVFIYLTHLFIVQYQQLKKAPGVNVNRKQVERQLMAVSVPTTSLRIFHALTHAVQPFLIKGALLQAGMSADMATEHFGMLAGVAMTIGFFPAFIAHSFLIILIPTVSKANANEETAKLQKLLMQVMLMTFLYGIPAVTLFYFMAEPLTNLFFQSTSASYYLQLLWPYFLFHFFVMPMQAYLIGLGLIKDASIHTVWATAVSFLLIYFLGRMPELQMDGVIIGMNTGSVLLTMLHYLTICKKIGITWTGKHAVTIRH